MQSLVNRLVRQKRLLDAIDAHEAKSKSVEREESDLSRWPSQGTSSGPPTPRQERRREEIPKFKVILGWRDNSRGPKKVLVIAGKEYDPYGSRVTLEQCCPKKLKEVISASPGLWKRFITDLSSVVEPFQDASDDACLPLFCFCFPCFLTWRSDYLARVEERLLSGLVSRHRADFEHLGLLLRHKDIAAPMLLCGMSVSQKISVVEIAWDPSLWTDRI